MTKTGPPTAGRSPTRDFARFGKSLEKTGCYLGISDAKAEDVIDYSQFSPYLRGMRCPIQTRDEILNAAYKRFTRYGYSKTSMAELAEDCCMSAGNLYRYFKGKLDIARALSEKYFDEVVQALRAEVQRPELSAGERLEVYVLSLLRMTYEKLDEDPHLIEMVEMMGNEDPSIINNNIAKCRSVIVEILAYGNSTGEFDIEDLVFTAEMIQSATMKFSFPQLFSHLSLEQLEREAKGVLGLIKNAIARHAPSPAFAARPQSLSRSRAPF